MHIRCLVWSVALLLAGLTHAGVGPGDEAPPITLEAISNTDREGPLSWETFKDKTVVLEFWGTWCGPCVAAIPHLNKLAEAFEDRDDIVFLSVTYEDKARIDAFREKHEMKSIIGHDTDRSMIGAFGISAWPTTFIIKNGLIVVRTHPQRLTEELLASILDTDDLSTTIAKARAQYLLQIENAKKREDEKNARRAEMLSSIHSATVQLVVLPSDPDETKMVSTMKAADQLVSLEISRSPIREIISFLWDAKDWQIEIGDWAEGKEFDVVAKVPMNRPELMEQFRPLVAAGIGVEVKPITRIVDGYSVAAGAGGAKLKDHKADMYPSMTTGSLPGEYVEIDCVDSTLTNILNTVSATIGSPFEIPEDLAGMVGSCNVRLPENDPQLGLDRLSQALGLTFKPVKIEQTYFVVTPLED